MTEVGFAPPANFDHPDRGPTSFAPIPGAEALGTPTVGADIVQHAPDAQEYTPRHPDGVRPYIADSEVAVGSSVSDLPGTMNAMFRRYADGGEGATLEGQATKLVPDAEAAHERTYTPISRLSAETVPTEPTAGEAAPGEHRGSLLARDRQRRADRLELAERRGRGRLWPRDAEKLPGWRIVTW